MFHIVLYQPEIAPNTGNVIRLCANTGAHLHLIEPLGFKPDDKKLRRAGLDYHDWANVNRYETLQSFVKQNSALRLVTLSTKHSIVYTNFNFRKHDTLVFGPETRGLPDDVRNMVPEAQRLCLPMKPNNRSLNLSNAVAVVLYEAWRQNDFF